MYPVWDKTTWAKRVPTVLPQLSARAHDKILRVCRTIADVAGDPDTSPRFNLAKAIHYRSVDRALWV